MSVLYDVNRATVYNHTPHHLLACISNPLCVQELPPGAPNLFLTLTPLHALAEDKTIRRLSLAHPVFR